MSSVRELVSLRAEGVTKTFGRGANRHVAVKPVDLEINSRTALGIVGESGSGKSTLSRLLVGLEKPTAGDVTLNGRSLQVLLRSASGTLELRRSVQYVAQDTFSSFDPRRTLRDAVATPLRVLRGVTGAAAESEIRDVLDLLRLDPAQLDRYPGQLSGGQRQRFSLARSLVVRPRVLLCDEVVSALDVSVQGSVLNMIRDYCETYQVGLGFVSHGLPATAFVSDSLLVMRDGEVVEHGPTDQMLEHPEHPYTVSLLDAYTRAPRHLVPVEPIQPELTA
ncbi:peptide/nickel transport system ATP-binding protein [Rathayibacter oskolensis]|uniref:Peptide/nickel transport system ATP-binding protein n=1 Tax=Rathayibacter oskolensis TaxID=1891671 RepID=A0A1X7PEB1_9MICO|nr:ATP-binding cassette domain-containing protein [Rathayibacter oskolensis]SMH49507.1 peptide/nickel transport system ATP-binding protein [Rathayibacter oskolensis]